MSFDLLFCSMQTKGRWLRIWVDIGSADSIAFDMLVNALRGYHEKVRRWSLYQTYIHARTQRERNTDVPCHAHSPFRVLSRSASDAIRVMCFVRALTTSTCTMLYRTHVLHSVMVVQFCTIRQVFIGGTNDDWPIDPRKDIPDGAVAIDDFEIAKLQRLVSTMKEEMGLDTPAASSPGSYEYAAGMDGSTANVVDAASSNIDNMDEIQSLDELLKATSNTDDDDDAAG